MGEGQPMVLQVGKLDDHMGAERSVSLRSLQQGDTGFGHRLLRDPRSCEGCGNWTDCGVAGGFCDEWVYEPGTDSEGTK